MTAKEKILDGILAQANKKAEEIINAANIQAEKETKTAEAAAEAQANKIILEAERKAAAIIANADSSAMLLKRDTALGFKSEAINSVIDKSIEKLNSYSDQEYFDFLYSLAEKNVLSEEGVMYLGSIDALRDKSDFKEKISALKLTLSDDTRDINGGFILQYNDILINCAFSSLINEKREKLIDVINKEMFFSL